MLGKGTKAGSICIIHALMMIFDQVTESEGGD
jgi:hypothetical protein